MSASTGTRRETLTAYEAEQARRIAAWKSEPPNPLSELFKRITLPVARVVEKAIPDAVVKAAIDRAYVAAQWSAGRQGLARETGVSEPGVLHERTLEACDRLAERVGVGAQAVATVEGALTGAGGALTTLLDIPLLFTLSLRTILKIGRSYGYPLDRPNDRPFVLGVLILATSSSLDVRRERLDQLRRIEDWVLEETQEEVIAEEIASFLFQLEEFEQVPGAGAISGALLNLAFLRKVDRTATHVFQERWLRDRGKVDVIEPSEAAARALALGWSGALSRAAYSVGFGLALPAWLVGALFRPLDHARARVAHDGANGQPTGPSSATSPAGPAAAFAPA
jgi:hypothetical protein